MSSKLKLKEEEKKKINHNIILIFHITNKTNRNRKYIGLKQSDFLCKFHRLFSHLHLLKFRYFVAWIGFVAHNYKIGQ